MDSRSTFKFLIAAALFAVSTPNPSPQFYPTQFSSQQPPIRNPQESSFISPQTWQQSLHNFSHPNTQELPDFLDPLASPAAEETLKNDLPRQIPQQQYGLPSGFPPSGYPRNYQQQQQPPQQQQQQLGAYPQIYKLDNLIIIANPQGQSCAPQRTFTPQFPKLKVEDDSVLNRFGNQPLLEPSSCVWAIIACCSPNSNNVRYSCFDQLGCEGFFVDNSPCDAAIVKAAARAALDFYNSDDNSTSDGSTNNLLNK